MRDNHRFGNPFLFCPFCSCFEHIPRKRVCDIARHFVNDHKEIVNNYLLGMKIGKTIQKLAKDKIKNKSYIGVTINELRSLGYIIHSPNFVISSNSVSSNSWIDWTGLRYQPITIPHYFDGFKTYFNSPTFNQNMKCGVVFFDMEYNGNKEIFQISAIDLFSKTFFNRCSFCEFRTGFEYTNRIGLFSH